MTRIRTLLAATAVLSLAGAHTAQAQGLNDYALYGVDGQTENLYRYEFRDAAGSPVGQIRRADTGTIMSGIKALAYVPGHQNIFGFWNDPADGLTKLAYINLDDATAQLYPTHFGAGPITGATAVKDYVAPVIPGDVATPSDQRGDHRIYAIQNFVTISGKVNIDPTNGNQAEFLLTKPDGTTLDRQQLHDQTKIDPVTGTAEYTDAIQIRFKPKGTGNQNGLSVNGATYSLDNTHMYVIHGTLLKARIWNDDVKAGKPMGQWWFEILSGSAVIEDWGTLGSKQSSTTASAVYGAIIRVDPATGVAEQVMNLSRMYDALAGQRSGRLYAAAAGRIYVLDTVAKTETALSNILGYTNVEALENAGAQLYGFSTLDKRLLPINSTSGSLSATVINIGDVKLRSQVFMRLADDPRGPDFD